jgi:PAS domain S-box-containing protein
MAHGVAPPGGPSALDLGEAAYRALAAQQEDCVFVKDCDGRYVAVNPSFARWVGRPEAELVGRTVFDLWPRGLAERYAAAAERALQHGRSEADEPRPCRGRPCTVCIVRTPLYDDAGAARGLLGVFRAREEGAAVGDEPDAFRRLAGGVAHDLNNLLTVVRGAVSLAQGQLGPAVPHVEPLTAAGQAADQAAGLAAQLLAFARHEARPFEQVELNAVVARSAGLLRAALGGAVVLEMSLAPALPPVAADPSQLAQVLLNLCLNARDAMPRGGRLLIETDLAPLAPSPLLSGERGRGEGGPAPGAAVRLRVADEGEGMPPAVQQRMFDAGFTTKPGQGVGLGLAVVQDVVGRHGGRVECHSAVGRGTCFDVYLPAPAPPGARPAAAPFAGPAAAAGGRGAILLADDEPAIRALGRVMLSREGYRVLEARDGREAVETYRQARESIGLVVLDQAMPRLSGPAALAELLSLDPAARVLMISGYGYDDVPPETRRGLRGFLTKPFSRDQFLRAVQAALNPEPGVGRAGG